MLFIGMDSNCKAELGVPKGGFKKVSVELGMPVNKITNPVKKLSWHDDPNAVFLNGKIIGYLDGCLNKQHPDLSNFICRKDLSEWGIIINPCKKISVGAFAD